MNECLLPCECLYGQVHPSLEGGRNESPHININKHKPNLHHFLALNVAHSVLPASGPLNVSRIPTTFLTQTKNNYYPFLKVVEFLIELH